MKNIILFIVAIYIRLSKEDGDRLESESVENQRKLIHDFLKGKEEFVVHDEYIDDGFTGTNFRRPNFKRMLEDIEAGKVNCVIVKDLSRFGRDYIDTGKYLERYFPDMGVRFISITDNIDSMKQAYDMLLPIKNIFNEQYARDISRKVHASMTTKQKAGEFIGAFASYGYKKSPEDKNKLVIDEYAAAVVRRIFNLYINGNGKIRIAHILNEEGIVNPAEYKRLSGDNYRNSKRLEKTTYWTYSTINRILQNEIYAGNMVQGKSIQHMRSKAKMQERDNWIVVENTHEPIIDADTWNTVQVLLKRRTRNLDLESNVSIFAGFLKCGDCGRALSKKIGKRGNYYMCGTYVRSGRSFCTPHTISHSTLEKIVLDDLNVVIQSIDDIHGIVEKHMSALRALKHVDDDEKNRLEDTLQNVRKRKKATYEHFTDGLLSKEEYLSYKQDYQKEEDLLMKRLAELVKQSKETPADILESAWIKRLLELKRIHELDRSIIVEMIDSIIVYTDNRIKIVYNFSKDLEQLFDSTDTSRENMI